MPPPARSIGPGTLRPAPALPWVSLALALCTVCSLLPLLNGVDLSPDSVNFVAAARNLLQHGEFFVLTNWPSHSMIPAVEPFTDHPPGYALYLLPFLAVFGEPFLAATVAQGLAVVLLFAALAFLLRTLAIQPILRVAGYLLITLLVPFQLIFDHYWTEPLFIAATMAGGTCAMRAWTSDQWRWWWWAAACFFLATSFKIIGVFNIVWCVAPLFATHNARLRKALLVLTACTLPTVLWFARNQLRYGRISFSHLLGEPNFNDTFLRPIHYLVEDLFAVPSAVWLSPLLILVVAGILLLPFVRQPMRWSDLLRSTHIWITGVFVVHFVGIWLLSLVAFFSILDDRLLAPSMALGIVAVLFAIQHTAERSATWAQKALLAAPFLFVAIAGHSRWPCQQGCALRSPVPAEAAGWETIRRAGLLKGATHFYSDRDFRHQLFADIPQRIVWDTTLVTDPRALAALLGEGNRPFFVFHTDCPERKALERGLLRSGVRLQQLLLPKADLVVLHQGAAITTP